MILLRSLMRPHLLALLLECIESAPCRYYPGDVTLVSVFRGPNQKTQSSQPFSVVWVSRHRSVLWIPKSAWRWSPVPFTDAARAANTFGRALNYRLNKITRTTPAATKQMAASQSKSFIPVLKFPLFAGRGFSWHSLRKRSLPVPVVSRD